MSGQEDEKPVAEFFGMPLAQEARKQLCGVGIRAEEKGADRTVGEFWE